MTSQTDIRRPDAVVLLGLLEIADLLPVTKQTVYRYRVADPHRPQLPEPDRTLSKTPLWRLDQVLEFAERMGHKVDARKVARLRKEAVSNLRG